MTHTARIREWLRRQPLPVTIEAAKAAFTDIPKATAVAILKTLTLREQDGRRRLIIDATEQAAALLASGPQTLDRLSAATGVSPQPLSRSVASIAEQLADGRFRLLTSEQDHVPAVTRGRSSTAASGGPAGRKPARPGAYTPRPGSVGEALRNLIAAQGPTPLYNAAQQIGATTWAVCAVLFKDPLLTVNKSTHVITLSK